MKFIKTREMYRIRYSLLTTTMVAFFSLTSQAQSLWDAGHLRRVKEQIQEPYYAAAYNHLLQHADKLLEVKPRTVMDKPEAPLSGDKHDYMSLARYYWPDPASPNGLPYINRDGVSNPEIQKYDRYALGNTAEYVVDLALAWYFSGNESYARKATELTRTFFLDKATRMNPNLNYAQVARGNHGDKGRSYGVLDAYSLVEMLDALQLLEGSQSFTGKDAKAMKAWVGKLLQWMMESQLGQDERRSANNHGTACDVMLAAFSLYTGDKATATQVLQEVPERRILKHINPDGTQPHELSRTLAFHYSNYNLGFYIDLCLMAQKLGIDLAGYKSADGRSVYGAAEFLSQYLGKEQSQWPYEQISGWEQTQHALANNLYRIGKYLPGAPGNFQKLYRQHRQLDMHNRFHLLWFDATWMDQACFSAAQQLEYALGVVKNARSSSECRQKNLVTPAKLTDKEHKLHMVGPNDWRSGFFPGEIWMMYQFTNDHQWRESAVTETWPLEEAKWNRRTHDLGFMMNNSFGKAYEITGERSYLDVVIQSSKSLATRFNPTVGCTRSWDHHQDVWNFPVIIDNMMNLEMFFRTTQLTGDSTYWKMAVSHANTTMKNHFRPDYSSYHVVDYNPQDGSVHVKQTAQGNSDDSFWARGQAWGMYGFTMCYRFTQDPLYLKQAEGIADFWLSLPNMPADGIPYWDMKLPADMENSDTPRDASAAAVACSALLELRRYVSPEKAARYTAYADKALENLYRHYRAELGTSEGFLLLHSTGNYPTHQEIDVPLNYADYYYVEALMRKLELIK